MLTVEALRRILGLVPHPGDTSTPTGTLLTTHPTAEDLILALTR